MYVQNTKRALKQFILLYSVALGYLTAWMRMSLNTEYLQLSSFISPLCLVGNPRHFCPRFHIDITVPVLITLSCCRFIIQKYISKFKMYKSSNTAFRCLSITVAVYYQITKLPNLYMWKCPHPYIKVIISINKHYCPVCMSVDDRTIRC